MVKKIFTLCLTGLLSASVTAGAVRLSEGAPEVYTVKKGDTFWGIAGLYLDKPWHWPKLWQKNPDIENPHLIYPDDVLRLSYQNGTPILQSARAQRLKSKTDAWPINGAPQSVLRQYLTYDSLVDENAVTQAPRVLGSPEGWRYLSMREPFYVDAPLENQQWFVYRVASKFERQLGDKTVQMTSLKKVAEAKLLSVIDDISEMQLIKQTQEVKLNDILLTAVAAKTGDIFHPSAAPSGLAGNMIGHLYGSKYVGLRQIVVVDLGTEDGLEPGNTLSAQIPGTLLKGGRGNMRYTTSVDNEAEPIVTQLPDRSVGTLLVIRSYPHFSLAMVADAEQPLSTPMTVIAAGG